MKTIKIFSVVVATMLFSMLLSSCSKEEAGKSVQIEQNNLKAGQAPFTWTDDVCAGQPIVFTLVGQGQKQIRMWGWSEINQQFEWLQVASSGSNTSVPLTYPTILSAGTYFFIYKIGNNWTPGNPSIPMEDGIPVEIYPCDIPCPPSFSYDANTDGSYTFTLIPAYDIAGANLVFTFAQGVGVTGLDGWSTNGSTRQKTMDLVACQTYTWTVFLTPNCSGHSGNSNVWTDFKVNGVSKKGSLSNIVIPCP